MEAALDKAFSPEALEHVRTCEDGLNADMHGSAEYRAHLVDVIAKGRSPLLACQRLIGELAKSGPPPGTRSEMRRCSSAGNRLKKFSNSARQVELAVL